MPSHPLDRWIVRRSVFLALALLGLPLPPVEAQSPPESAFIEELTWMEIRDLLAAGKTSILIATGGAEQKGPHMVMGEHDIVLIYTTDQNARTLGNALVSPIISYVPEGTWGPNPTGHMCFPGTITPGGGAPGAGVTGDPTKATVEIGRMVVEFKVPRSQSSRPSPDRPEVVADGGAVRAGSPEAGNRSALTGACT